MARQADNGLIYSGKTYIRNLMIPGAGFVDVGNVTSLALKSESESKERISKQKGTYGVALDSINTPKPTTFSMKCDTFDRHNLAMALMGQDVDFNQTEETVTDAIIEIGQQGQWYSLGKTNIDPDTVALKTSPDTVVDKTAYQVHAGLGMIQINEGSNTVLAGDSIKASFKTKAVKGFQIQAGVLDNLKLEIMVEGENRTTGKAGTLHIPSVSVGADSEIDWFGDDFAESSLAGTVVKAGDKAPYTFTEIE